MRGRDSEDTNLADDTGWPRKLPAEHTYNALQVHKHMNICEIPGVLVRTLYTTGTSAWILTPPSCPQAAGAAGCLLQACSTHTLFPQIPHIKYPMDSVPVWDLCQDLRPLHKHSHYPISQHQAHSVWPISYSSHQLWDPHSPQYLRVIFTCTPFRAAVK